MKLFPKVAVVWCLCSLSFTRIASGADEREIPGDREMPGLRSAQGIEQMPDVHFWTTPAGVAQLDYRAQNRFFGTKKPAKFPISVNTYGGAINYGDWRLNASFTPPLIIAAEQAAMASDNTMAAHGANLLVRIQLTGSGIEWGATSQMGSPSRFVSHGNYEGRSYLRGPIRIHAHYIRFDGPISRIGPDVELTADRIVINGVDLPAQDWRQSLEKLNSPHPTN